MLESQLLVISILYLNIWFIDMDSPVRKSVSLEIVGSVLSGYSED
jgi:hypothetical protein